MKILFLIPYPLEHAPSQRFRFEQYFDILRKEGYEISVRSFFSTSSWQILYLKGYYLTKLLGVISGFWRRIFNIWLASKSDFIFIHREVSPLGPPIFEWFITRALRKKVIYDFDDAIWLPNTSSENRIIRWFKFHQKTRHIIKNAWRISAGNNYLAQYAHQYNQSVFINPTTIDTNYHQSVSKVSNERLTIGWTGTHSTIKYLLKIIPILQRLENHFEFRLLIISNQQPSIQMNSFEFRPWKQTTEILDLNEIDIGLMPLEDDDWAKGKCGFKILQYLALEIPALAAPVGVNKEIIEDGVDGYLCYSAEDWSNKLALLLNDKDLRLKMGINGRKKVIDHYSVDSNKTNFLKLFTN